MSSESFVRPIRKRIEDALELGRRSAAAPTTERAV